MVNLEINWKLEIDNRKLLSKKDSMAKKTLTGVVVSDKMMNTVVVSVARQIVHPLYKKRLTVNKKYSADTNGINPVVGDLVKIEEIKPLSKTKYFKVVAKIGEDVMAKIGATAPDEATLETNEANAEVTVEKKKTVRKTTKKGDK